MLKKIALLLSLSFASFVAHADTQLFMQIRGGLNPSTAQVKISLSEYGALIEDAPGTRMLFLQKNNSLYLIDDKKQEYVIMDQAKIAILAARMTATRKKWNEQLQKLTPKQREQAEAMLGKEMKLNAPNTAPKQQRQSEQREIAGYGCQLWEVTRGKQVRERLCVAEAAKLGMNQAEYRSAQNLYKLLAAFSRASTFAGNEDGDWSGLGGVPIWIQDGKTREEQTLEKITHERTPNAFVIPAAYKELK